MQGQEVNFGVGWKVQGQEQLSEDDDVPKASSIHLSEYIYKVTMTPCDGIGDRSAGPPVKTPPSVPSTAFSLTASMYVGSLRSG